jgi:hypothetical protein
VSFAIENSQLKGEMKLEKSDSADMPPWRVIEQRYVVKTNGASAKISHLDWTKFDVNGVPLFLPLKTTSRGSGVNGASTLCTTFLLPATVSKLPDNLPETAFRVPRGSVPHPYDRTIPLLK